MFFYEKNKCLVVLSLMWRTGGSLSNKGIDYPAALGSKGVYIRNTAISKSQAAKRVKSGLSFYTFTSNQAILALNASGLGHTSKAEIHLKKGQISYYHYHTKNRNGSHAWYGKTYTK